MQSVHLINFNSVVLLLGGMIAGWNRLVCIFRCCVCFAVSSGSITVNADSSVQLLAEEAFPLDQLDVAVSITNSYKPM